MIHAHQQYAATNTNKIILDQHQHQKHPDTGALVAPHEAHTHGSEKPCVWNAYFVYFLH